MQPDDQEEEQQTVDPPQNNNQQPDTTTQPPANDTTVPIAPESAEQHWSFAADESASADQETEERVYSDGPELSWTASEFIAHEKSITWYLLLMLVAAVLITLSFLLTKGDKIVTVVTAFSVLSFGVFASRKPRTLEYLLDHSGLTIGGKHYTYAMFKSFSVQKEDAIDSIFLMPMKRYLPGLTLYYPQEQEDKVIDTLSSYLPHELREPDMVDRLMRKVRF